MEKMTKKQYIEKNFFKESKFNRARTAMQGFMGKLLTDNDKNPSCVIALVGRNCFIDGNGKEEYIEKILNSLDKYYKVIIANEKYFEVIEKFYKNKFQIASRFSTKRNTKFDDKQLRKLLNEKLDFYEVKKIDKELLEIIAKTNSYVTNIEISENYENYGIGFCAINKNNNEIIGIATSNAVYDDGIEINLKVSEEYRRKKIATVLCSNLILECLNRNIHPYWDAFNKNSLKLAEKLGYELEEEYKTYKINQE